MPDDVNPALRAELLAALAVLEPQIRGLHGLASAPISPELLGQINAQVASRERRRDLINAVLTILDTANSANDALAADGYPALPNADLPPGLFAELQGEEADLDAAVAIFEEAAPATTLAVNLGEPAEKPL